MACFWNGTIGLSEKLLMGLYGGSSTESVWVNSHYFSIWCRISHTEMKYMTFKERSTQYLIYLYIDSQYGSHFFFFFLWKVKSCYIVHLSWLSVKPFIDGEFIKHPQSSGLGSFTEEQYSHACANRQFTSIVCMCTMKWSNDADIDCLKRSFSPFFAITQWKLDTHLSCLWLTSTSAQSMAATL